MKLRQIVLVLALSWPVSGLADFKAGVKAYDAGDYATAMREFRPLAEQGELLAQFYLGVMYSQGFGVLEDYAEARKWYRLAAKQGYRDALYNLGVMYRDGEGVPEDYVQAYTWFNLAASKGSKFAIINRDKVRKKMTPSQIEEGQELSRELFKRISKKN